MIPGVLAQGGSPGAEICDGVKASR